MAAKSNINEFAVKLFKVHGDKISLAADAEYLGSDKHIKVECQVCPKTWDPLVNNLLNGRGCPSCHAAATRERLRDISRALVGTTNKDNVTALDIKFEWKNIRSRKAGGGETARLRCRCPHCGNEDWWVRASNFQKQGNSTHCGCQKVKRENINTHLNKKGWAEGKAMLYISPVWFDQFIKIGITNDFNRRSTAHDVVYDGAYFVSHLLPRAWVYVAEQILLKETLSWQPTEPLPKEMVETYWPGSSELRIWQLEPDQLIARFKDIIKDIESDGDWYRVYQESFKRA
jgi:hypothetical protein